ncbi:MAG: hypothetical protein V5A57_02865, partial [Candidatus Paceibacterota bacterium]
MNEIKLKTLFERDPTRSIEPVQKVDDLAEEQVKQDIDEFVPTESIRKVLSEITKLIDQEHQHRFLYVHAMFGSGKSHLLKLIGLAMQKSDQLTWSDLNPGKRLADEYTVFQNFRREVTESNRQFIPLQLNLLDRDPATSPTIARMVFNQYARSEDFPLEPEWLSYWLWQAKYERDFYEDLVVAKDDDGRAFAQIKSNPGKIRSWLLDVVPGVTDLSQRDLKEEFEDSQEKLEEFGAQDLAYVLGTTEKALGEKDQPVEFVIGLDEIALYVGDNAIYYDEIIETCQTLKAGPNPIIIGTGQWSIRDIHGNLKGSSGDEYAWLFNEIELEAAEIEKIVTKRWLEKNPDMENLLLERFNNFINENEDVLGGISSLTIDEGNWLLTYPFRPDDLGHLRQCFEELLTEGVAVADRDYARERALLVLIRILFSERGWAEKELGALVPWNELFELLLEETNLIRGWVDALINGDISQNVKGYSNSEELVKAAKVLFLVNRTPSLENSAKNVAFLRLNHFAASLDEYVEETKELLNTLVDEKVAFKDQGKYRLLQENEIDVQEEIRQKKGAIPIFQIEESLKEKIVENSGGTLDNKNRASYGEKDFSDDLRRVLYDYDYTIFDDKFSRKSLEGNGINIRIGCWLKESERSMELSAGVQSWQEKTNLHQDDLLIAIGISGSLEEQLKDWLAHKLVLSGNYGSSLSDLRSEKRRLNRNVKEQILEALNSASIYLTNKGGSIGEFKPDFSSTLKRVIDKKFPDRKVLSLNISEIDDAKGVKDFFSGADWPRPDDVKELEMLGIDESRHSLTEDGFLKKICNDFNEQITLKGKDLNEYIADNYPGTPYETIELIVISLWSSERLTVFQEGEVVEKPSNLARILRSRSRFKETRLQFGEVRKEKLALMRDFLRDLSSKPVSSGLPGELKEEISEYIEEYRSEVNSNISKIHKELPEVEDLELLKSFINKPDIQNALSNEEIELQKLKEVSERYRQAINWLDSDLYRRLPDKMSKMSEEQKSTTEYRKLSQIQEGSLIPAKQDDVKELIEGTKKGETGPAPPDNGGSGKEEKETKEY